MVWKDYIFALLTGYVDPPAGVEAKEGLHYNPYFNGGWIGMAKALYDEIIEYSDGKQCLLLYHNRLKFTLKIFWFKGTPASTTQLAKDVSVFLKWSAEKSHDEKKKLLLKVSLFNGWMPRDFITSKLMFAIGVFDISSDTGHILHLQAKSIHCSQIEKVYFYTERTEVNSFHSDAPGSDLFL